MGDLAEILIIGVFVALACGILLSPQKEAASETPALVALPRPCGIFGHLRVLFHIAKWSLCVGAVCHGRGLELGHRDYGRLSVALANVS